MEYFSNRSNLWWFTFAVVVVAILLLVWYLLRMYFEELAVLNVKYVSADGSVVTVTTDSTEPLDKYKGKAVVLDGLSGLKQGGNNVTRLTGIITPSTTTSTGGQSFTIASSSLDKTAGVSQSSATATVLRYGGYTESFFWL